MLQLVIVIAVGVILLVGSILVFAYNRFVRLAQNVKEAWSAIDTELARRHDLIPALVEVVKGYAGHERGTLEAVVAARSAAIERGSDEAHQQREAAMVKALHGLLAVVERYPALKASEQFANLHKQLVETEDRLSKARRFYNANIRDLNTAVQTFPWSLLAGPFGFRILPYFEVEGAARNVPAVKVSGGASAAPN